MATGTYDGARELRSRLPDVPDTVIAYFLSKYNVEECYEKLKNGYDESADMSDFDGSLLYVSDGDRHTNAQTIPEGRSLSSEQPWAPPPQPQGTQNYPQEISPSHFHAAPNWHGTERQQQQLPYPTDDTREVARAASGDQAALDPEHELLADQRQQLECIHKIRDSYAHTLTALRADTQNKRDTLTALRIKVSEGPTVSILDTASLQDIISTLEYDIQTLQNKIQVEKTQAKMKGELDVYTEEGVRWNCGKCGFLNHPLMTRCERCNQTR